MINTDSQSSMGNEMSPELKYQPELKLPLHATRSYRVIPKRRRDKTYFPGPDFGKASVVNKPDSRSKKWEKEREARQQKEHEEFVKQALTSHNEYR